MGMKACSPMRTEKISSTAAQSSSRLYSIKWLLCSFSQRRVPSKPPISAPAPPIGAHFRPDSTTAGARGGSGIQFFSCCPGTISSDLEEDFRAIRRRMIMRQPGYQTHRCAAVRLYPPDEQLPDLWNGDLVLPACMSSSSSPFFLSPGGWWMYECSPSSAPSTRPSFPPRLPNPSK